MKLDDMSGHDIWNWIDELDTDGQWIQRRERVYEATKHLIDRVHASTFFLDCIFHELRMMLELGELKEDELEAFKTRVRQYKEIFPKDRS